MSLDKLQGLSVIFFLAAAPGDQREFAVLLKDGKTASIQAFEQGYFFSGFRPNETVFALSEAMPFGDGFRTKLLHVEANAAAQPRPVAETPDVVYKLSVLKQDDAYMLRYRMDDASREKLRKSDFHPDYPFEFKRPIEPVERKKLKGYTTDPAFAAKLFSSVPLPPHHPSPLAKVARHNFASGITPPLENIGRDDWEEPVRLSVQSGLVIVNAMPADIPPPPGLKH